MHTTGLIGGLSWYSTAQYYRTINEETQRRLGGHGSAEIAMRSVDFAAVREHQLRDDWPAAGRMLAAAGRDCEAAGADVLLICSNLMHKVADDVAAAVTVPVLHIPDIVAAEALGRGLTAVGLLATRWVMEEPFYRDRLAAAGVRCLTPGAEDRAMVDRVIFEELTQGTVREESARAYARVVADLADAGAQAVVLACTEIELLLRQEDCPVPLIDSMALHALAAVDLALAATVTSNGPDRP
ncbi:aspartate/glutamate racemase family protein [Nocardioides renjunii]|uniref:aspartate/glutamate racemase family protein n=1 Tax=Nocardioides renjunii TaxID=3095075 RepID=UPI002AFE07A2|nr:amino acid racemase [Nocardioides sp. S-34]WQQ23537.1 amino acid racemase [Nocardioides sp. S-34]